MILHLLTVASMNGEKGLLCRWVVPDGTFIITEDVGPWYAFDAGPNPFHEVPDVLRTDLWKKNNFKVKLSRFL
jgi:hypothetical protein